MVEKVPEKIKAWPGKESWLLWLIGCNISGWNDMNRNNYMKRLDHILNAVAIWLVTGRCFQNTKWPAVLYILSKFHKSKQTYQISIKKSQAILNCFTDLKCSVCFTLGKTKPCFVTLETFFRSTASKGVEHTKWPAVRYFQ